MPSDLGRKDLDAVSAVCCRLFAAPLWQTGSLRYIWYPDNIHQYKTFSSSLNLSPESMLRSSRTRRNHHMEQPESAAHQQTVNGMNQPNVRKDLATYFCHHTTPGEYVGIKSGTRLLFMLSDRVEERIEVEIGAIIVLLKGVIAL